MSRPLPRAGYRSVLRPGPDHPITIGAATGRVRVTFAGRVVVDTTRALVLREASYPPVFYLPLADVDTEVLEPSARRTYCPYKGEATYYTLRSGDRIAGHLAFYPQHVTIEHLPA